MAPYYTIVLKIDAALAAQVDRAGLRAAARAALEQQQAPGPGTLSVMVTDDAALRRLNSQFLGIDRPTDVLSFPNAETEPESGVRYYGDIAISLPRAQAQARVAKHSLLAELQLLVAHGVLHLLGHDHARAQDKARMWQAQGAILSALAPPLRPRRPRGG